MAATLINQSTTSLGPAASPLGAVVRPDTAATKYTMLASQVTSDPRSESVAVVGSGVAGLITAYTLLRDGFTNVKILTRDLCVGGVWATNRIYPGLYLNKYETLFLCLIFRLLSIHSVHGEYRLSPLEMPAPSSADGRLSGDDMAQYMAKFTSMYLQDRVEFGLDISNIRRGSNGKGWLLDVHDVQTGNQETRPFTRLVVCTGVRGWFYTRYYMLTAYRDAMFLNYQRALTPTRRSRQASRVSFSTA